MLLIRCRASQQTISQTTCQTTVDVAMQKLRSLKLTSCMRSSFLTGANSVVLTLFEWIAARLSQCMSHASKARGQCKVLVEKLLRSCPEIDRLYLLIRPTPDKDIRFRLQELTKCQVIHEKKQMTHYQLN